MANKKFDWKITLKKTAITAGIVVLTGVISLWQEDPKYMALIPVVTSVLNVLKHKYGMLSYL